MDGVNLSLDRKGAREKWDGFDPVLSVAVSGPGEILRQYDLIEDRLKSYKVPQKERVRDFT